MVENKLFAKIVKNNYLNFKSGFLHWVWQGTYHKLLFPLTLFNQQLLYFLVV